MDDDCDPQVGHARLVSLSHPRPSVDAGSSAVKPPSSTPTLRSSAVKSVHVIGEITSDHPIVEFAASRPYTLRKNNSRSKKVKEVTKELPVTTENERKRRKYTKTDVETVHCCNDDRYQGYGSAAAKPRRLRHCEEMEVKIPGVLDFSKVSIIQEF